MDKSEIQDLLEEVADSTLVRKEIKPFNQPSLITISSANRLNETSDYNPFSDTAFSSFSVDLPRPALDVKSLQLLSTNIPQSNANLPNTACVFWYYRLSEYSGLVPTINNLHYVRLLPSWYKQEFITNSSQYGYNKTFNSYNSVSTELAKSCATDLLWENYTTLNEVDDTEFPADKYIPFLPNDVLVEYDPSVNKFQMTGNNTQVVYKYYNNATLYVVGDIIANEEGTNAFQNKVSCKGVRPPVLTNPAANTLDAWVSGTTYTVGSVVVDGGVVYQCTANGANVTKHPYEELTTHWTILGRYNAVNTYTAWSNTTNYNIGQTVSYNGVVYVLTVNGETVGVPPPAEPTKWTPLPTYVRRAYFWDVRYDLEIVEEWDATTVYPAGMIVAYNNQTYQAEVENVNVIPEGSAQWNPITFTNWYKYLITGYDDPNVKKLQGQLFNLEWNEYTTYKTGQVVLWNDIPVIAIHQNTNSVPGVNATEWVMLQQYYKGQYVYANVGGISRIYQALQNNINVEPPSALYWKEVGYYGAWDFAATPTKTGLYGLTKLYDFVEFDFNTFEIRTNYPYGVGGQPYNPEPKRLLNSVLGFTWNGVFNPVDYQDIGEYTLPVLTSKKFPFLYNRLRPVPKYTVAIPIPEGYAVGDDPTPTNASTALTFTADSYANLVYSSVISIYANIVGASSVDTQKTSSLLAITSMNCGTLGVAFWNNYVDNPLLKVQGDMYTITIDLKDEFGEPYYLSNNAVATLTFKASY